jgi:hypothetical protein
MANETGMNRERIGAHNTCITGPHHTIVRLDDVGRF